MTIPQEAIDIISSPLTAALIVWLVSTIKWLADLKPDTKQGVMVGLTALAGTLYYAVFTYGDPALQTWVRALNAIVIASAASVSVIRVARTSAIFWNNVTLNQEVRRVELKARAIPPTNRPVVNNMIANPRPPLPGAAD